jgi:hypothetical protein
MFLQNLKRLRHGIFTIVGVFANYDYTENLAVNVNHKKGSFLANGFYPTLCSIINEARLPLNRSSELIKGILGKGSFPFALPFKKRKQENCFFLSCFYTSM